MTLTGEEEAALRAELAALIEARTRRGTTGQVVGVRDPDGRSVTIAPANEAAAQARIDYLEALLSSGGGSRRRPITVRF